MPLFLMALNFRPLKLALKGLPGRQSRANTQKYRLAYQRPRRILAKRRIGAKQNRVIKLKPLIRKEKLVPGVGGNGRIQARPDFKLVGLKGQSYDSTGAGGFRVRVSRADFNMAAH
jgi:hypothetical protein